MKQNQIHGTLLQVSDVITKRDAEEEEEEEVQKASLNRACFVVVAFFFFMHFLGFSLQFEVKSGGLEVDMTSHLLRLLSFAPTCIYFVALCREHCQCGKRQAVF